MTNQIPDKLVNEHPRVKLDGLRLRGITGRDPRSQEFNRPVTTPFSTTPRPSRNVACSACHRGYVATFVLQADGRLRLSAFEYMWWFGFGRMWWRKQRVDELGAGDFWLAMSETFYGERTYVPFRNGVVVEDRAQWLIDDPHSAATTCRTGSIGDVPRSCPTAAPSEAPRSAPPPQPTVDAQEDRNSSSAMSVRRAWSFEWWPRFHDRAYQPSIGEQVVIHWRANLLMLRSPLAITLFLLLSIWPFGLLLLAIWCIVHLGPGTSAGSPFVGGPILGPAAFLASFVGYLLLQHVGFSLALVWTYAPFVRAVIRQRGTPICLHCGQLLHAADAERCPECGGVANEPPSIGRTKRGPASSSSARTPV